MSEEAEHICLSCVHYTFDAEIVEAQHAIICELTEQKTTSFQTCARWADLRLQIQRRPKGQLPLFD